MRYDSLYDFWKAMPTCNGCGNDLSIALITSQKKNRNYLPKYIYEQNFLKGKEEFNWSWAKRFEQKVYLSRQENDDLILYALDRSNIEEDLLTINIKTGKIKEEIESAQQVIWNFQVGAYKYCAHDYCKCAYFAEAPNFCLERNKNKIFNVVVLLEGYMLNYSKNNYLLSNSKDYPGKTLLVKHNLPSIKDYEIIKELPIIDFRLIKHNTLINKVQTILTFS